MFGKYPKRWISGRLLVLYISWTFPDWKIPFSQVKDASLEDLKGEAVDNVNEVQRIVEDPSERQKAQLGNVNPSAIQVKSIDKIGEKPLILD